MPCAAARGGRHCPLVRLHLWAGCWGWVFLFLGFFVFLVFLLFFFFCGSFFCWLVWVFRLFGFFCGKIRVSPLKAEGAGVVQPRKGRLQGDLTVALQELINRRKSNFLHGQTQIGRGGINHRIV